MVFRRYSVLIIEHRFSLSGQSGVGERSIRGDGRRGQDWGLVRVHIAESEYPIVQGVRVRTAGPPRAPPPHLALLGKHFLRVKRKPAEPHVSPAAVRYHELHCKTCTHH